MFLGIFIALAGIISLLEICNIISSDVKWGIPLMFTCLGFSIIFDSLKAKRKEQDN